MTNAAQAGVNQPGTQTSAKPAEMEDHASPPVDDDAGGPPPADNNEPAAPAKKPGEEDDGEARHEARKPPSDSMRDKIAARFEKTRGIEKPEGDDAADEGSENSAAPGEQPKPSETKTAAGETQDDDADQPERLTLKVFGKDHSKTIDEIAVLADMTPEEVRENPDRAVKFAQRELATTERLNEAKRIHREAASRLNAGDADTRGAPRAPDKERPAAGDDKNPDQPKQPAGDQTGKVNFKQLAEVLQIEDPEVAGQKLQEAFEQIANTAKEAARETVSEEDRNRLVVRDRGDSVSAMREFTNSHPEVAKNPHAYSVVAAGLIDEYRTDLVKALVAEGTDQDEAESIVSQASRDQITTAHQQRRIAGDPHVRRISKDMMESAYGRVAKSLGIKIDSKPSSESLTETRQARKEKLAPQPQRASVPKGTPEQAAKPPTKSQIVAEMAAARGQRGRSASR